MTSWYRAICDEHKECCSIFVVYWGSERLDSPPANAKAEFVWLSEHWTCKLRLVRDDNEDKIEGYVDRTPP